VKPTNYCSVSRREKKRPRFSQRGKKIIAHMDALEERSREEGKVPIPTRGKGEERETSFLLLFRGVGGGKKGNFAIFARSPLKGRMETILFYLTGKKKQKKRGTGTFFLRTRGRLCSVLKPDLHKGGKGKKKGGSRDCVWRNQKNFTLFPERALCRRGGREEALCCSCKHTGAERKGENRFEMRETREFVRRN